MRSPQVVVLTGASAGTTRVFGARGAHIGLLVRGQAGLTAITRWCRR